MFGEKIACVMTAVAILSSMLNPMGTTFRKKLEKIRNPVNETVSVTNEEAQEKYFEIIEIQRQYLPSIVCWGDSLTYGAGGEGTSYPKTVERLIKENITDKFDLKKVMNASDSSEVEWDDFHAKNIAALNMGIGGERSDTICGRAGVIPFTVCEFTIPEEGGKVPIEFEIKDGQQVLPLLQGDGGVNPVTVGDVKGKLSFEYTDDGNSVQYYFTPSKVDEETKIEAGSEMICAAADKYKDSIMVIMMGGNGGHNSLDELIGQYKTMLTRQDSNADRYIIVGYHGTLGALNAYPDLEERFKTEFGDHYISLSDYFFSEKALVDAGIEITDELRAEYEAGKCPTAFLADPVHFNAIGYELVGKLVYERMDSLGYFDEVKEAYGLMKK